MLNRVVENILKDLLTDDELSFAKNNGNYNEELEVLLLAHILKEVKK